MAISSTRSAVAPPITSKREVRVCVRSVGVTSSCCVMLPPLRVSSVDDGEHQWNKKQGGEGSHGKTADDRTREGCVLFPTLTQAEGHRQHADDHRAGGHDDGSQPCVPSGDRGGKRSDALPA